MASSVELCEQKKKKGIKSRAPEQQQQVFVLLSALSSSLSPPPPVSAPLGQCNSISLGLRPKQAGKESKAVLVTYMRDELGSCAPGSFTAVALFYIYGAAAGPAVARCESHDSSAGNRDGPVILAPHRLHVTPPALPILLLDAHRSPQRQAECPQTRAQLRARVHTRSSFVPFTDTSVHLFSRTLSRRVHCCVHI